MPIDQQILEEARKIRLEYSERPEKFNCLLMGKNGTGKTRSLITARKPVYIDMFDPYGAATRDLKQYIDRGEILVKYWDYDEWKSPKMFQNWVSYFEKLRNMKFFDNFATYALDSITTWARFMAYEIILQSGHSKTDKTLSQGDYKVQLYTIMDMIGQIMALPCDVIITGHIDMERDEITGEMETSLLLAGKQSREVPCAFMEKWIARVIKGDDGKPKHVFQVHTDGKYHAETRIGGKLLSMYEEPDIKCILRKAGRDTKDKELFLGKDS